MLTGLTTVTGHVFQRLHYWLIIWQIMSRAVVTYCIVWGQRSFLYEVKYNHTTRPAGTSTTEQSRHMWRSACSRHRPTAPVLIIKQEKASLSRN